MNSSTTLRPADLLSQMADGARVRFGSDAAWARASGVPKETLSRLRGQPSCDLRTLAALAGSAGCTISALPRGEAAEGHMPVAMDRGQEEQLLDLAASGDTDAGRWRALGPGFFMGGVAVMLAGSRGFGREAYLALAEELHPGVSTPEVFALWLRRSPLRPSRFLPMARRRRRIA